MWIVYSCADGTVCDSSFRTSIELLRHTAEQHDNTNDEKVTGKEMKFLKETEEDMFKVENWKFTCARCLKIVPLEDTFDIHEEIVKKMCQFCTMISQYG